MLDSRCNPSLFIGNCQKFEESWNRLGNFIPQGPSGNGISNLGAPYGITPLALPRIPYNPPTVSLARPQWEGWRYGANYVNSEDVERPYGFPDYQYYRGEYCGPCCPCVGGTNPPLMGDPQGKNPDIRYIQLDYKNLLGSGFAMQGPPQSQTSPFTMAGPNPGAATSCGRDHCKECSGVYKKTEQPVKFQVCIGDQSKPETVQPCPVQPMKIYLPLSMIPRGGPDGDKADDEDSDCEGSGGGGYTLTSMDKQQFEVSIPGRECAYNQQQNGVQCVDYNDACKGSDDPPIKTKKTTSKSLFDPCGSCKACKNPPCAGPKYRTDPTKCQITCDQKNRAKPQTKSTFVRNC